MEHVLHAQDNFIILLTLKTKVFVLKYCDAKQDKFDRTKVSFLYMRQNANKMLCMRQHKNKKNLDIAAVENHRTLRRTKEKLYMIIQV